MVLLSLKLKKCWKHKKNEFKQLYNPNLESVDTQFATEIGKRKVDLENIPIQLFEVEKVIRSCIKRTKHQALIKFPMR